MSIHSSSLSKQTEFTFCNISYFNDNAKPDEHPFVSSPSFGSKSGYSSYNYSSPSTKARNKILEMLNNLPEGCQELSLKDIVIDDLEKQRSTVDQKSDMKTGLKDRKTVKRERPVSRSVSLDTGSFMLKMFNPISCGMKKSQSSSRVYSNINSFSNNKCNGSSHKSDNRCLPPNTKSRSAELAPGCWFINKPWKLTSQRGCIV
ncbi:hypothetical protein L1987_61511 [Smallanthus sonchifolius]|uniref:Uncharacterized protein n=1 Tax=Smallanthus sonchifolius TaxID=185202 RepID=A0ACB9C7U2_9ASTR|nr:hypothetical protein L1987_61511 [Smallanthus sonchifolius]